MYLNEKLKVASHFLDFSLELLSSVEHGPGARLDAGDPLQGEEHCSLYG